MKLIGKVLKSRKKENEFPAPPVSFSSLSDSIQEDFGSYLEAETPSFEIDMAQYETEEVKNGVKSPVMGVGMIAALAGGLFVVLKGLRE